MLITHLAIPVGIEMLSNPALQLHICFEIKCIWELEHQQTLYMLEDHARDSAGMLYGKFHRQ